MSIVLTVTKTYDGPRRAIIQANAMTVDDAAADNDMDDAGRHYDDVVHSRHQLVRSAGGWPERRADRRDDDDVLR